MSESTAQCSDLDEAIDHYTNELGYRLDMIAPADAPREAVLSKGGETIWLELENHPVDETPTPLPSKAGSWTKGRAGMEYRDLIPGRMGGKVIASHIRLQQGGEVPDYVHYHKISFQMIYCKRGRIRVVYEDQGEPFWLETGDCVLQPPEIRHRVLECTAGAEVVEVSMPAEHETWVEHEITLPTNEINADRKYDGQRFVRHIAADAVWTPSDVSGFEERNTGIQKATNGVRDVRVLRSLPGKVGNTQPAVSRSAAYRFCFVLAGAVDLFANGVRQTLMPDESIVIPPDEEVSISAAGDAEILLVSF